MNNISVLYSEEELALSVKKLGAEITEEYKGKKLLVVCVLKGAFVFTADLVRRYADRFYYCKELCWHKLHRKCFNFRRS